MSFRVALAWWCAAAIVAACVFLPHSASQPISTPAARATGIDEATVVAPAVVPASIYVPEFAGKHVLNCAPEPIVNKCETQAGPFSDRLAHRGEHHDDCPGGVCHRHEDELKVQVEIEQPKQTAAAESDPVWVPIVVGAALLVILIVGWYVSALDD